MPKPDLPEPEETPATLPQSFAAELEGVDAMVPVTATLHTLVEYGEAGASPLAELLASFLVRNTGNPILTGQVARAAIYELRNVDDQPFWGGENSSMGQQNQQVLIDAFAEAAPPLGDGGEGFVTEPSLLLRLLRDKTTVELAPTAESIAELIAALIQEYPAQARVERRVFVRTSIIDDMSGEWTHAFFVDPTPLSGPDTSLWMVAWTDAWTE